MKHSFVRNVVIAGIVSVGLAACIETAGNERIAANEPVFAAKARGATPANTPAVASSKSAASSKTSLPDQVRAQLKRECMAEHSGPFRTDSATGSECDCFAGTVVNSLRPSDLDFYITYDVIPTLSGTRPEEVKKTCGIAVLDRSGPRGPRGPS